MKTVLTKQTEPPDRCTIDERNGEQKNDTFSISEVDEKPSKIVGHAGCCKK